MSATAKDLLDEFHSIANGLIAWQSHRNDIAKYVLPQTEEFDAMLATTPSQAFTTVAKMPVSADRSPQIYDMTSIWGIERLTAGLISLKTPETVVWQDLGTDEDFDVELDPQEQAALERVRDYLFKVRSNPRSGFWPAHKAAMRSMCAFGDGWLVTSEQFSGAPWRYEFVPLNEIYPACNNVGMPDTMYRPHRMSARNIAAKFKDVGTVPPRIIEMANDPKKGHDMIQIMQCIRPRENASGIGVKNAPFASYYMLPEDTHIIGEGGYFEFPYTRYAWSASGTGAQSEGPVAFALGEIKALQEMSKNELIAQQTALRPPMAVAGRNFGRINFNPGKTNPNLITPDGKPLFAPLNTGVRPDFAQAVIESRRNNVREMLYLNLWQILIEDTDKTATEAMIRAQEKGELLGPVGISLNGGLSQLTDREIAIMDRKGAFAEGAPLELPETLMGANISPTYTSPLDRLRRMGELIGIQRLAAFAGELSTVLQRPDVAQRLDGDFMLELAREVLGAPVGSLVELEAAQEQRGQAAQMQQVMGMLEAAKQGGAAMGSIGAGAAQLTQGAEVAQQSPVAPLAATPLAVA